jgi:hypothetical protein
VTTVVSSLFRYSKLSEHMRDSWFRRYVPDRARVWAWPRTNAEKKQLTTIHTGYHGEVIHTGCCEVMIELKRKLSVPTGFMYIINTNMELDGHHFIWISIYHTANIT